MTATAPQPRCVLSRKSTGKVLGVRSKNCPGKATVECFRETQNVMCHIGKKKLSAVYCNNHSRVLCAVVLLYRYRYSIIAVAARCKAL